VPVGCRPIVNLRRVLLTRLHIMSDLDSVRVRGMLNEIAFARACDAHNGDCGDIFHFITHRQTVVPHFEVYAFARRGHDAARDCMVIT
jgi:hypothetical protein